MNRLRGKAFVDRGNWKVESNCETYLVEGGFSRDLHPVLRRGRDENRWVEFELDKYNQAVEIEIL